MPECYLMDVPPARLKEIVAREGASEELRELLDNAEDVKVLVDPERSAWELKISSTTPFNNNLAGQLQELFLNHCPDLKKVKIDFESLSANKDKKESSPWLAKHWENLKNAICKASPAVRSAFEYARPRLEDKTLIIEIADYRWVDFCREKEIDSFIGAWIEKKFGRRPEIKFKTGDFSARIEQDAESLKLEKMEELEKKQRRQQLRIEKEKTNIPLGGKIKSKPVAIAEMDVEENHSVTLQGQIIEWDFKQTSRGKKNLYTGVLTDNTDSISLKIFRGDDESALPDLSGAWVKIRGRLRRDNFGRNRDEAVFVRDINRIPPMIRTDDAPLKRVELHCHTNMSRMDGLPAVEDIVERAAFWDQPAVAISDHGVVHSFPKAYSAGKKYGVKIIFGLEGYLVEDDRPLVLNVDESVDRQQVLDDQFVIIDCETTGVSPCNSRLFHAAALRIKDGEIVERFESPVAVNEIDSWILDSSPLDAQKILDAPSAEKVTEQLQDFAGELPIVIYEADFIRRFLEQQGFEFKQPLIHLRRIVEEIWMPEHAHLDHLYENRFQAGTGHRFDARCDVERTLEVYRELKPSLPGKITVDNLLKFQSEPDHKAGSYHVLLLARNQTGLQNLYKLVSWSHTKHFYRFPRMLRSELEENREGLLIGTACEKGEIFQHVLQGDSDADIKERMKFYDFIEIQPCGNNSFMLGAGDTYSEVDTYEDIRYLTRRIYELGKEVGKPVAATSDAHFLDPEQEVYRSVLQAGQGFSDADNQPPVYMKTTDEMIDEFEFLGEEAAIEVSVSTPLQIADLCEDVKPIPEGFYPPRIEGAEEEFLNTITERCRELYGSSPPEQLRQRFAKEKEAIVEHQFSNLYIAAARLVQKSLNDGYLVGSRGSVGSSFTAYLMGITEVNPLPAHYRCPECSYSEFPEDSAADVGVDLPPANCPECGKKLQRDGYNIPFEVFCGFEGDKVPDIDLNFSGEYQQEMFRYVQEMFGKENVYRAGTITTIAKQTAGGFVRGYLEERNLRKRFAERIRLMQGVSGIKQNTSQHPGGMIVVPEDHSIYEFTPINYPANDREADFLTTHFDYHAMEEQLVKLDILGQDDPTQLRHLQDLTGIDPTEIPLDDQKTLDLFSDISVLGVTADELGMETGVLAVPEFGTSFVRDMVEETRPSTFADLLRISGLSHGTDVWLGNARDLISAGTADLKSVITCRDDIMNRLIEHGLPEKIAFDIMERVRKGKGITGEQERKMRACKVPNWYIESCKKIKYLFPKAHAAAYVIMAFRIAYFKVHYPAAFYASYFSLKADFIDATYIDSLEKIENRQEELQRIISIKRDNGETVSRDQSEYSVLEVAREAYLRGIKILSPRYSQSAPYKFKPVGDNTLLAPYVTISGLGGTAAAGVKAAFEERPFSSIEDVCNRTALNSTVLETATKLGFFEDLPKTEHIDLFAE